jgi:hypothetical protein
MSSKYFHKNYPLLYVADIVLPFCKKFMEKSTFVDFHNFLNIIFVYFCLQCLQKCENDFRDFFAQKEKTKISVCKWSGSVTVYA